MAHNLVDVDTWTAAITVPDDGDAANAASVEAGMQDLGDRSLYLRNRIPGAAATHTVVVPSMVANVGTASSARFVQEEECVLQNDVTDSGWVKMPIFGIPTVCTIALAKLYVTGLYSAGAHAGLVETPPMFWIDRVDMTTGVATSITGDVSDPHAGVNLALYETMHAITSPALAEVTSATRSYYLNIRGEGGANATANKFAYYALALTITP